MDALEHPYRSLYALAPLPPPRGAGREIRIACGVLIAVSAIQLATGAQVIAGALGLAGGVAGLLSTRRRSWTTSSSSS
jgi:hypothetical protein